MKIKFIVDGIEFAGELNDSKTANGIYGRLPIESTVDTWGDEIYFDIGLKFLKENPTIKVKVGDIAYWPDGSSMCIFFGPTPISRDQNPRPASHVNPVGTTDCLAATLKGIKSGSRIRIEKAV